MSRQSCTKSGEHLGVLLFRVLLQVFVCWLTLSTKTIYRITRVCLAIFKYFDSCGRNHEESNHEQNRTCEQTWSKPPPEKKNNTSLKKDVTYNARIQNLITLRLLWEVKSQFVFLLLLLAVYWYTPETVQTRLGSPEPPLRQDLFLFLLQGFHIFGWV
jgi:hypothetical protein